MRKIAKKIICAFVAFFYTMFLINTAFAAVNISDFRLGNQSDGVRVVFDMNKSVNSCVSFRKSSAFGGGFR